MDYDSLTSRQKRTYLETVSGTHHRRVEVDLLTIDGALVRSWDEPLLGGNISGDDSTDTVERAEVQVLDLNNSIDYSYGRHRHYKLRITDSRYIPDFDEWVHCVCFTGPLWDFRVEGPVVTLIAQGTPRLAMGSLRRTFTRPRKSRATAVIRDLLTEAGASSSMMSIPGMPDGLPESVTIGITRGKKERPPKKKKGSKKKPPPGAAFEVTEYFLRATPTEDTYWQTAYEIAEALDRDLFCDGRGRILMRAPQSRPSIYLTERTMLAPPVQQRGDDGEIPNTWLIIGADPKGPKKRVSVQVQLPPGHPASAESLAWHGKPRNVTIRVENDHLRNERQARALGIRKRDAAIRELTTYEVQALPIAPWIRPAALASIPTAGGRTATRVHQWTLPLGPTADPMTLGANRRGRWGS